jgi:hypothetical protein
MKVLKGSEHEQKKEKTETLTSSNEGVEELPGNRMGSLDGSTLALFGEEARGLAGGVECSTFC